MESLILHFITLDIRTKEKKHENESGKMLFRSGRLLVRSGGGCGTRADETVVGRAGQGVDDIGLAGR